jgi:hypothetical protein
MAWHGMLASRLRSSGSELSMMLTEDIFEQGFHAGSRFCAIGAAGFGHLWYAGTVHDVASEWIGYSPQDR